MDYIIRKADFKDLPRIEEIYACARAFMARNGNPTQWGTTEPPSQLLQQDIRQGRLYVLISGQTIHGVFYFYIGPDPTYCKIYEGAWRQDALYGTIHRIAGDGSGGILKAAVAFCCSETDYLRIDTHADNTVMQAALTKLGFHPCGTIYVEDGTPRIAYDLL